MSDTIDQYIYYTNICLLVCTALVTYFYSNIYTDHHQLAMKEAALYLRDFNFIPISIVQWPTYRKREPWHQLILAQNLNAQHQKRTPNQRRSNQPFSRLDVIAKQLGAGRRNHLYRDKLQL